MYGDRRCGVAGCGHPALWNRIEGKVYIEKQIGLIPVEIESAGDQMLL